MSYDLHDEKYRAFTENVKLCNFLKDLIDLYEKHDLSISHEDIHGAFVIEKKKTENIEWILNAHVDLD